MRAARGPTSAEDQQRQSGTSRRLERIRQELREVVGSNGRAPA